MIGHPCVTSFFPGRLIAAVLAALFAAPTTQAFEFASGELKGNLDTTISVGIASRVEERSDEHVGVINGGSAFSVNFDDGNLNYDKGVFSSVFKVTTDLDLQYRNMGAFVRAFYFYDSENERDDRERTPLSDEALELVGSRFQILDAFVSVDLELGGRALSLRLGDQVVSWGESTFIPNGINVINPVDVSKLRSPGAELRQAFLPVTMLWASYDASDNVSVEAFVQFDWEKIKIDPAGSYFGTNDFASDGGSFVYLGSGLAPDLFPGTAMPFPPGTGVNGPTGFVVPRGRDRTPDDDGQYGVALRWFVPQLNDTELGFYFINYHSRLPLISATTGTLAGVLAGDYAATARYFVEYPEDIKLYGVSFNTNLGTTGIALQGEVSYRQDVPLQVDDAELLIAALSPLSPALGALTQLGGFGFGTDIQGFRRLDVTQGQVTATKVFGPTLGADQWVLIGEVAATRILDMPDKGVLRLEGPGTYASGNPFGVVAGLSPVHQTDGFGDGLSFGYRIRSRLDYNNALGAINLSPGVAFAHDVAGTTPVPLGNFVEDRKALTLSLAASYQNTWNAKLSYTSFFGAEEFNQIQDRDFVAFQVSWSK